MCGDRPTPVGYSFTVSWSRAGKAGTALTLSITFRATGGIGSMGFLMSTFLDCTSQQESQSVLDRWPVGSTKRYLRPACLSECHS